MIHRDGDQTRGATAFDEGLSNRQPSSSGFYWPMALLIFVLAAVLRTLLAIVNREANDDHFQVVELILAGGRGLTMADCHECFHPKLFYYVCATIIDALGLTSESSRIVAGQLLNSVAGLVTLVLVFLVLNAARFQPKYRLWTFALFALNPRFIAINAQFSNDSFAILFATAAVFLTLRLLKSPSISFAVLTQAAIACALMTKGTTWVVVIAMLMIFFVRSMLEEYKRKSLFFLTMFIVTFLNGWISIEIAGYDFEHYDVYANLGKGTPLYFWEQNNVGRPGVRSIVDGYLTFRIGEILQDPQITNGVGIEQQHRTSVWTQLYGRASFAQFEQHPPSWITKDKNVLHVARGCLVLGLLPLVYLLAGLGCGALRSMSAWRTWGVPIPNDYASLFFILICFGYLAFIIKFTADYRDFAAMKIIYVLPGAIPLVMALLEGMQRVGDLLSRFKIIERTVQIALLGLVILYCVGILALVNQLSG